MEKLFTKVGIKENEKSKERLEVCDQTMSYIPERIIAYFIEKGSNFKQTKKN